MNMKLTNITKQRLIAAGLVVAVGLFAYLLFRTPEQAPPALAAPRTATVIINEDDFSPATLTIHPGTTVIWQNEDQNTHYVESDPYPSATDLPGLNSNVGISHNDTYQYTFNQKGSFGYHDRLNPTEYHGTIVVQ